MKGIHVEKKLGVPTPGVKFAGALYLFGIAFQATVWNRKVTVNLGRSVLG